MWWQPSRGTATILVLALGALLLAVGCATTAPEGRSGGGPERDDERRCSAGAADACAALGDALVGPGHDDRDLERGMVLLEVACGQEVPGACAALARVYLRGTAESDRARARDLASRGCARREGESCTVMGEAIRVEDHDDLPRAWGAFREGCQLGDARGCELFGVAQWEDDVAGDKVAGETALERACAGGRLSACHVLGVLRIKDPRTRDAGWSLLAETCRRGHAPSCSLAAYAAAPVISKHAKCAQALPFADRACTAGDRNACAVLTMCRLQTLQDDGAALDTLHEDCAHRVPLACLYWADHQDGRASAPPDRERVASAYRAACRGGFPAAEVACPRAAALALARAGDPEEAEEPLSSLERACGRSSSEACCALGDAYRDGKGVVADPDKARDLRAKACELGSNRCCQATAPTIPGPAPGP